VNDENGNYGRKVQAAVIVAGSGKDPKKRFRQEKVPGLFFAARIAMAADEWMTKPIKHGPGTARVSNVMKGNP
jgi:hypothetical protein